MTRKTRLKIQDTLLELRKRGIKYKLAHFFVYHAWLKENKKCNLYATTRNWKSFNNVDKGSGIDSLYEYLKIHAISDRV